MFAIEYKDDRTIEVLKPKRNRRYFAVALPFSHPNG
jgi:hypothetical protein